MKYFSFLFFLVAALTLSGCSMETEPASERKDAKPILLDKLPKEKPTEAKAPEVPQTPPQPTSPAMNKKQYPAPPAMSINGSKKYSATLHTSEGDIVISLDVKNMPVTVNNFVFLAREKFYDNTIFHRTMKQFMIQGGDPQGTGVGGPGYKVTETPKTGTKYSRGTIASAKTGMDPAGTSGSQFFIMHADTPLPADYATFGEVVSGLEVVDKIASAPTKPGGEGSSPVTPVVVTTVDIVEEEPKNDGGA